jgi:hypothetical protein
MRKPKPPSPRSVSATLAAAYFRATRIDAANMRTEGFQTEWAPGTGVRVRFATDDPALRDVALSKMAGTLRRKGWQVSQREDRTYLTVTEDGDRQ